MKEMLIENKDLVLKAYSFIVFFLPWLFAMYWNVKLVKGIKEKMGAKFWFTIVPNKEVKNVIDNDPQLTLYKNKRNFVFPIIFVIWVSGYAILALLIAWLNNKL